MSAELRPYLGLRKFEAEDAPLYFGRDRETLAIVERLRYSRFLAITGESGCGKSSVLRAGVLPALYRGAMSGVASDWRIAIMQPGDAPIARLAAQLAEALTPEDMPPAERKMETGLIETILRSSSRGLVEVARQWIRTPAQHLEPALAVAAAAGAPAPRLTRTASRPPSLLVLVDQFEEIFRFKEAAGDEARQFVRLLLTAADEPSGVFSILTMRADFLGDCAQFAGLPEAINRGEFLLSRMTRDELRLAITGPAAVARVPIAPALVTELLNQTGDEPSRLPVLQHALMRTWQRWKTRAKPGAMDLDDLKNAGGLDSALAQHGDEILKTLSPADAALTEKIFRALTETDAAGRTIRRATRLSDLAAICGASAPDVERIVLLFAADTVNFLTVATRDGRIDPASRIDLTHESLMKHWPALQQWMDRERQDADTYRALSRDAALRTAGQRGLWREPELTLGQRWLEERRPTAAWAERYATNFPAAVQFLNASRDAETRRVWLLRAAAAAVALLVLAVAASLYFAQKARADSEMARAQAQQLRADALKQETDALQKRIDELRAEHPELSAEASKLRDENRELQWNILQTQRSSDRLQTEIGSLTNEGKSLTFTLAGIVRSITALGKDIENAKTGIAGLQQQRDSLRTRQAQLTADVQSARAANAQKRGEILRLTNGRVLPPEPIDVLRRQTANLVDRSELPRGPVSASMREEEPQSSRLLDELRFRARQLELENLRLKKTVEELRLENGRLRTQLGDETKRNRALIQQRDRLRSENQQLQADIRHRTTERDAAQQQLASLRYSEQSLRAEISRAETAIQDLANDLSSITQENRYLDEQIRALPK